MRWTDVPAGEINAAIQRFWDALGNEAGMVADRMKNDIDFARQVALFAVKTSFQPSISQRRAREIMGRDCFGIEEAVKYFGVNPTEAQLAALAKAPFSEAILESVKGGFILVAVFPMSILDIRDKVGYILSHPLNCPGLLPWYEKDAFAMDKGEVGWRLVRKTPVPGSTRKLLSDNRVLLSKDEEIPLAQVMVYTIIGHYLAAGERLFEKVSVQTDYHVWSALHSCVGPFDHKGLHIIPQWGAQCSDNIGCSSALLPAGALAQVGEC
ncbi:MAG: hypothetical protein WDZ79_00410 [Candidatus Paceibacterota bacterium]